MNKNIGVIGLGLIGGSFAKALKKHTQNIVFGYDINKEVCSKAQNEKTIDFILCDDDFAKCDMFIIALYPRATEEFIKNNINIFKKGTVIIDCAGVKENLCQKLSSFTEENGLYFIGGHPMAGTEKSGFENSFAELFEGASMIFCKDEKTNIVALKAAELLFLSIGFKNTTITSAETHDKIIAFTSQLAHVVSNAYVKSETANNQMGFSAGSYKDLTRVAYLEENMWTELFLENKNNLIFEIDSLIERLSQYSNALKNNNEAELKRLLLEGKNAKKSVG